jgi:hypothetical protein
MMAAISPPPPPAELQAEQRWSTVRERSNTSRDWLPQDDDRLMRLVTTATASGDRFPVGVNCMYFPLDVDSLSI